MPWIVAILVVLMGMAMPSTQFYWGGSADEQAVHTDIYAQAPQKYFTWNIDDFQRKPGLGPDVLGISPSGLPPTDFEWPRINLSLKEDEAWRRRNLVRHDENSDPVPVPGSLFLLGAGFAALGIIRKRLGG